ncbi:hypothetical protein BDF22DRAFT_654047 [Syncephalis plumigaleata]|nr:hypothetical protein BDF22DRAFT_654047 [Syncephalis plumigaleata]
MEKRKDTPNLDKSAPVGERCRLFVGNLAVEVTEYTIIKLFERFGKVAKLDFPYYTEGSMRGKPRNFCFIEYATHKEAHAALQHLSGRKLYGRPLDISWYKQTTQEKSKPARITPYEAASHGLSATIQRHQKMAQSSVDHRIKALERKLAQLSKSNNKSADTSSS